MERLIDETLTEGPKEQLCFGLNDYHIQHMGDEWKKYTKKRVNIGMAVRSIQLDTAAASEYKKRDADELRITKLVPNKKYPTHCELNIIGEMKQLIRSEIKNQDKNQHPLRFSINFASMSYFQYDQYY